MQIEQQRQVQAQATATKQVFSRVEKVRADHEGRVVALEKSAAAADRCAQVCLYLGAE